jgi:hypothetical protein
MVYRNPPPTTETFVQEEPISLLNHVKKENNYAKLRTSSRTETFVQELHVDPSQDIHTIVKNSWQ